MLRGKTDVKDDRENEIDWTKPVGIDDFRRLLGEAASHVRYGHRRIVVERRGKPVGVFVSLEDYERLLTLEAAASEQHREGTAAARVSP